VHAVGGVLMAEAQQTSDATFRLFDWNRPGPDGHPRKLHIQESLKSIDWSAGPVQPVKPQPLDGLPPGIKGERLVACDYFQLDRYPLTGSFPVPYAGQLSIWLVLEGTARLKREGNNYHRDFHAGETVLIPASAHELSWQNTTDETILLGVRAAAKG
jgi:mannose-6-phosphate isomerase